MMIKRPMTLLVVASAFVAGLTGSASSQDDALQMVSIDVEGGGGTLFVTPDKHSLLIDAGNPEDSRATGSHSSSERIVAAAHELGLNRIDYVLTTHYHVDHVGGLPMLLKRIPVGTFIDHGPNREVAGTQAPFGIIGADGHSVTPLPGSNQPPRSPAAATNAPPPKMTADFYDDYLKAIAGHRHIIAKPGDVFHFGGLTDVIVAADAKMISKPLPGVGEENSSCAGMQPMFANGGEENTRSIGSVLSYGKVKIAAFGDLTWDREKDLFCPQDKVGRVDVYLASHHGTQWSGSPAMLNSLQPIVTIMGNSAFKGDDPERVKTIEANPRFKALWRLHGSRLHPQIDGSPDMIANPSIDAAQDGRYNVRLRIRKNGEITVINERNGFNKTYQAGN